MVALCSDGVFVRRAFLDLTGKLPTAEEARAFIQDPEQWDKAVAADIAKTEGVYEWCFSQVRE